MKIMNFKAKIIKVNRLTTDALLFTLTVPENFSYEAGQYVVLMIKNKGVTKPRLYSILSAGKGKIQLCSKLISGGFASEIFAKTEEGDSFEVKGPFGYLIYDKKIKNKEIWFLCGGTGVVPFYSIIKENLPKHPEQKFVLIFSARIKQDLFLNQEFKELEKEYSNFEYQPTLTREEWKGKTGRISKHLPDDLKNKTFYICGTKELVLDVKKYLLNNGVDTKDIKIERCSS